MDSPLMTNKVPITLTRGDGIGPEIMDACLHILTEAGAQIEPEEIVLGERVYLAGTLTGITQEALDSVFRTGVVYKAPLTTPQGSGFKSVNVTLRKTLGLFANVRPVVSYHPFVATKYPDVDIVIIRENEEDLYAGIEHRQTREVYQTLKLISRPGSERIIRYAFEFARRNGRKKVTCFTKDNIMKMTDGLFHKVFDEVSEEYPEIETDHKIIDIGAARAATQPETFDVIVMSNLYGDIVSDIVAELTGSVGLAGSANVGDKFALFEAIHGSAPDIAGRGIANPSGLLLGGIQMLLHIGQPEVATRVHNAWLRTIEDGIHTGDIFKTGTSKQRVNTKEFTDAVVARLGQEPQQLKSVSYESAERIRVEYRPRLIRAKQLVGVDLFLDWGGDYDKRDPNALGEALRKIDGDGLQLILITNRGQKVWPQTRTETFLTDHWRCRFESVGELPLTPQQIINLLSRAAEAGFDVIKTENLYMFDGERGFSLGQGQ